MTAEIAILNKTAVALAADSAVTVSAGSKEEKIFDTADKLFELSHLNPIGVMIYNGTAFMEIPLPALIRDFRSKCPEFRAVPNAAEQFLRYLYDIGLSAPQPVKQETLRRIIVPIIERVNARYWEKLNEKIKALTAPVDDFQQIVREIMREAIEVFHGAYLRVEDALFMGGKGNGIRVDPDTAEFMRSVIDEELNSEEDDAKDKMLALFNNSFTEKRLVGSSYWSSNCRFRVQRSFSDTGVIRARWTGV